MAADIMDHLIKSMSDLSTSYDVHMNSFIKNTQTQTPLQVAAAIDGVDTCRRLVADGATINAKCQDFNATAMHYAALNEKHGLEVIEYFTSLKMRVDTKDKNGKEPIFYAIRAKNFQIAEKLLKLMFPKGELSKNNLLHICVKINNLEMAKIVHSNDKGLLNKYGEHGRSTIHVAAVYADLEMCKWLLSEGADVRALTKNNFEQNVLRCAAYNTSHGTELVQFFVSKLSFDVNAKDKLDFRPLHSAVLMDNIKTAEELMKLGAFLTVQRVTNDSTNLENLMHYCMRVNKMKSAKFLQGKNPHLVNELRGDGYTSLHIAACKADLDMCKWLVDECALDPRALAGKQKWSVLDLAASNTSHGKEIIQYLVSKYSLDVNRKDDLGYTPLYQAFFNNNIVAAEELVRLGADLKVIRSDTNDSDNLENLMHYCVRENKTKCAKFLQEKNRNLVKDLRGDGYTSLHIAAYKADLDMCKWLVDECGLDPRAVAGERKLSVLDLAAYNTSHGKEIITFLVNTYALDVNRKDEDGYTPLHHAFFNNNIVAAEELVRLGADLTVKRGPENLLHFSVFNNKVESAKYLIEKLAGLLVEPGEGGKNIVQLAAEKGDKEMMKLLYERM